jgi:predicted transposase/invertase (TIGR01784 family)
MSRFLNPFTDVGFKRIFGQEFSKPLLLDFLNNLLKGERVITDLKFLDKEQPAEFRDDRSLIYDIFCETDNGDRIIVEMQNREHPNFADRCLYYASQAISRQGERGTEWNYHINAVYMVAFVNFHMEGLGDQFRYDIGLADMATGKPFSGKERFIFLQLPCFKKEADECKNDFERWIYVLKNMETFNRMPWAAKNSVFRKLAEVAEVSNLSKEDRIKYDAALRHYRDTLNAMQGAEDKGLKKGLAIGEEKGLAKGITIGEEKGLAKGLAIGDEKLEKQKRDFANEFLTRGCSYQMVKEVTGLSEEELKRL